MKRIAVVLLAALPLALVFPAQAEDITIGSAIADYATAGSKDIPIAIPRPKGDDPDTDLIWEVVRHDLEMSGFFVVIDPDAYLEPASSGIKLGEFKFDDWSVPDPMVLAKTGLDREGDSVKAEVWVYDVPGMRKVGAKRFTASASNSRRVAHRIADEIILHVTGVPGIFTTRLTAVSKASGNKEINILDVDGHGVAPVTQNGSINLQPAWSADGGRIAFTSYRSGNPDLFVADLMKGTVKRVSARSGVNIGASWHPSGEMLALTLSSGSDTDIFGISDAGKALGQLTRAPGIDVAPAFSPDGSQVAFASERSGGLQIYVMPTEGGDARRVTFEGNHNTDPAFSPDGKKLAFVGRDGAYDVFTVDLDGSGMKRITQGEGTNENPTWSPDGRYLAFSSTRDGTSRIWMSSADGRHQVPMTSSGGWSNPDWSPRLSW
ncbi:MAG: Tol-Pal system beta propeller repeat protein TolB [Proteobacteria bacterium]|nr:Tol-Pal system beta propeller repeat protein TolB [Pseudomonadota bacterium]MCP4915339.1 Tol-Pal system beta propeller repeat protein TolB [Pseudomonadota bacterium]